MQRLWRSAACGKDRGEAVRGLAKLGQAASATTMTKAFNL